jgi:hypothetical protein
MTGAARAGAAMLVGAALIGVLQAWLWSAIAPGEQFQVAADGQAFALPTESFHQFTSIAIFVLIGLVVAVGTSAAAWHRRSLRGATMLGIVVCANVLGALTAYQLGAVLADGVDPTALGPSNAVRIVTAPPVLGNVLVMVIQPAVAAAIYTFLALWNGNADLGRPPRPAAGAVISPADGKPQTDR